MGNSVESHLNEVAVDDGLAEGRVVHAGSNCITIGLPGKSILGDYRVSHPIMQRGFSEKF